MDSLAKIVIASAILLVVGISTALSDTGAPRTGRRQKEPAGEGPRVLWREPVDIASRDLYYGPGGKAHQPTSDTFTFQKEDHGESTPKFDVLDANGVKWRVKLGSESRPETVATRLVWAVGYFANEDYFLPVIHVQSLPSLRRGARYASDDGTVRGARLKRFSQNQKKIGYWEWGDNPFKDSREWYGLQVLMALINNWDLKDTNNAVYQESGPPAEQRYLVSDLGSSFGDVRWDSHHNGDLKVYSRSRWINSKSKDHINFTVPGIPGFPYVLNLPYSVDHVGMLWIGRNVPIEHARWMGNLLGRLSPKQIRDAFRAADYSPEDVERFSQVIEKRIADLKAL